MILANFITQTLALLDDETQEVFTDAHITAALRTALTRYSMVCPYSSSALFNGTSSSLITLTGLTALGIQKAYHVQTDPADNIELDIYTYQRAGTWYLETRGYTVPTGTNNLLVVTQIEHLIDDLDAAASTTIPVPDQYMLCIGAAAYACLSRARQRMENNTLNRNEAVDYMKLGTLLLHDFNNGLVPLTLGSQSASWVNPHIDKAY